VNVGDIQTFLKSLGTLLEAHQGKKPATEFAAFCDGLEPFRELSVGGFGQFLRDAAEYKRTGILPVPSGKKGRAAAPKKAAAPKVKAKTKDDVETVRAAAVRLQGLYDRFADAALTTVLIDAEVDRIEKEFDAEGLKAVARAFGITSGLKGKAAVKGKIRDKILERKDRHQRSEEFSGGGKPAASPPEPASPRQAGQTVVEPLVEEVED
jgi:hypothetical protein